ncbi:MAG: recombinase family protein [Myxococcales bacterium]|nr:recombinase family protein [Myxococcales bacterium]
MAGAERKVRRCATYTRKSSEEGLEQNFNSLDAQRESCEAYIRSQAGEGWKHVRTRYDDGGYSGGTLDRPALGRLLEDIEAGKIDTIVVYKVDRLTRSLADFAKIVEVLDAHDASFVSVTQQFNTTTSMGRLTLNMLLSFAQFEREVTGERIRDKIAASKRKGLWMGGHVPLGYEPNGRTLAIAPAEAETVRTLFRLYLELGTVRRVKEEADCLGLTTKVRSRVDRRMRGGRPFSRGHIYHLLSNPLYIGRIAHHGDSYEGQHPAIISPETWDAVQKRLAAQSPARPLRAAATRPNPLRGKLFDEAGALLTPSHTVKSGRRYRYYVSRNSPPDSTTANAAHARSPRWRLPAREIERAIGDAVVALFENPAELARAARESQIHEARISDLLEGVRDWSGKPLEVVQRVDLGTEEMAVHVDLSRILGEEGTVVRYVIPTRIRRRGVEMRLVLHGGEKGSSDARIDPALVKAIVRGRQWFEELASGRVQSIAEIAKAEGVTGRYVAHLIPLAFLAPDIVARVLSGTQPVDLTTEELTKRIDLPLAWTEQRALMGFD